MALSYNRTGCISDSVSTMKMYNFMLEPLSKKIIDISIFPQHLLLLSTSSIPGVPSNPTISPWLHFSWHWFVVNLDVPYSVAILSNNIGFDLFQTV